MLRLSADCLGIEVVFFLLKSCWQSGVWKCVTVISAPNQMGLSMGCPSVKFASESFPAEEQMVGNTSSLAKIGSVNLCLGGG